MCEGKPIPQEIELAHHSPRAALIVLEVLNEGILDCPAAPYLGLMVETARFGKDYGCFDVLMPWFPFWLDEHHRSDRDGGGQNFDNSDIGHYLCLAELLDCSEHTRNAEMLARTRLAPGFDKDWREDAILRHEEGLIGKFTIRGVTWTSS